MRRAFAAFVVASSLCCGSSAMALGFGAVSNATRLGQPLEFTVAVKLNRDESLQRECVAADVRSGDARLPASQVRTRLVRDGRATDALVRVTTTVRLHEPVVTVVVLLGCPPRSAHKVVSLLEPPADGARREPPAAAPRTEPTAIGDPVERERENLRAMRDYLERLQQDHAALSESVAALRAKVRATEEMGHDPLPYGLATLAVLLLGVVGLLPWRQAARRHGEASWRRDAQALESHARLRSSVVPESSYPAALTEPPPALDSTLPATTLSTAPREQRERTAEELVDLEQQADFFIALGQQESAIDLLMAHVRSSGGTSPLPYLKLLEIYRQRGEPEAYERVRERFNLRFNVQASDWGTDPSLSRSLQEYPEIVERLQRAWPTPARASELLEGLLFRRDAARAGFDLPAYQDLLLLYGLARVLLETQAPPDGVDLLLPLDVGDAQPAITHVAAGTPPARPRADASVDLDLDLGGPAPATG